MQEKKTNPALLPETDPRVLIARLRARSLAEGETEGNSLYRDSANALEVAATNSREAVLALAARVNELGAELDMASIVIDGYAGMIFSHLSQPGLEGGYALAEKNLKPYLGARRKLAE